MKETSFVETPPKSKRQISNDRSPTPEDQSSAFQDSSQYTNAEKEEFIPVRRNKRGRKSKGKVVSEQKSKRKDKVEQFKKGSKDEAAVSQSKGFHFSSKTVGLELSEVHEVCWSMHVIAWPV